ncbi:alpha/beta hydrolase [Bacteroides propionicifaciens]|uniref:alpha/beta hydrolase n=1 Tax=Bacteroides propionicifaciens TaxID=392838 RepID=UPI00036FE11E|nr:alpha/beta hydrolase [Bacteroides propionicifaciens]
MRYKFKYLLIALMMLSVNSFAQNKEVLPLWSNSTPYVNTAEKSKIKFSPTLTIYHANNPNGKAVISCPGGGYSSVSTQLEGHDMASWFNDMGITYIVLDYRLPKGNYLVPLSDVEQAILTTRKNAASWKIKPNKIGLMGASAGGHLAATQSTLFKTRAARPDFQILLYPVITMNEKFTHKVSRDEFLGKNPSTELVNLYSCDKQVTRDTPPAFITLSTDDTVVPAQNSIFYYLALLKKKVSVALFAYPTGGHGWAYKDSFKYKKEWTSELEKWLQEVVK